MAHIDSLTAVKYTTLWYSTDDTDRDALNDTDGSDWSGLFTSSNSFPVGNIREFPSLGTPANIVNVPVYGQSVSSQVGGQADAPTLEFTLNYVPTNHAAVDDLRRNSTAVYWRVRMTDADAGGLDSADAPLSDLGYADIYFRGTVQSFEITPSLSDAMQATFSVSIDGDFAGPFSAASGGTYGPPA